MTGPRPKYMIRAAPDSTQREDDWRDRAACRGCGIDLWFPVHRSDDWRTPREVCGTCPVKDECLTFALEQGESDGIWGGLDPDERARLRRNNRRKAKSA